MTPKPTPAVGGSIGKGGSLRDLLSSVAQQVESHLHPSYYTSASSSRLGQGRLGRRSSRIRSWIVHDKDKLSDKDKDDSGDNSLHFTDGEDDDFARTSRNTHQATDPIRSHHREQDQDHHNRGTRMHMRPDELREEEAVDTLTGLMGDGFDREVARRILKKYDGDLEKAGGALLEGERGEEMVGLSGPGAQQGAGGHQIQSQGWPPVASSASSSSWGSGTQASMLVSQTPQTRMGLSDASALGGRPNTPVIDLTLEDEDLQRAVQESMNTLHAAGSSGYTPSYSPGYPSLSQVYPQTQREDQMMVQLQQPEGPVFGPSERAPDSNWAMVPSHVSVFLLTWG